MAKYVKVTKEISDFLGNSKARVNTADGGVLRWQADLDRIPGATLEDRAAEIGGAVLTPFEAAQERDGVGDIHTVTTSEKYVRKVIDNKEA